MQNLGGWVAEFGGGLGGKVPWQLSMAHGGVGSALAMTYGGM